jgi:hypothetical protein
MQQKIYEAANAVTQAINVIFFLIVATALAGPRQPRTYRFEEMLKLFSRPRREATDIGNIELKGCVMNDENVGVAIIRLCGGYKPQS